MTHITYKTNIGNNKPNTLINKNYKCPFCNREELHKEGHMLRETSEFLIAKNKYPVLEGSYPAVIVEHNSCNEHIGTYSVEYLERLLKFCLSYYADLEKTGSYKSIAFFKNHGIFSGGSIQHPHMQIIGFQNDSYEVNNNDFNGIPIISNELIEWNFSNKPKSEFFEINLTLKNKDHLNKFCAYLQKSVQFVLQVLNTKHQCYNLAFQIEDDCIKVKIISRGPTSILLLGFGIHQTPNNLEELADQLRNF
ncbi:DUF4931 domain-containing protein [Bacillus megaterium]|nr:DUF4931 domain-containing protein [Priestia megaterium]